MLARRLALLAAFAATPAAAQRYALREVHRGGWGAVEAGLVIGAPQGDFARNVNTVGGFDVGLAVNLTRGGPLALRIDGSYLVYGNEDRLFPIAGTGGLLANDLTSTFAIASLRVGPQLTLGAGPARLYGFATIGGSDFFTETSPTGDCSCGDFSTTNFDDATASAEAGGGLVLRLGGRRTPVSLDLGARFVHDRPVSYLVHGSITQASDGSFVITPVHSAVDMTLLHLGVTFGF